MYEKLHVVIVERLNHGLYIVKDGLGVFHRVQREFLIKISQSGGSKNDSRKRHARDVIELKAMRDTYVSMGIWRKF